MTHPRPALRRTVLLLVALAPGACSSLPPNPPLVSGASPAFTNSVNAEPQSANSLPADAEGLQSSGPNSAAPNYLGATFKAF